MHAIADSGPLELKEAREDHDVGEIFRLFGQDYERRYPMTSAQRKVQGILVGTLRSVIIVVLNGRTITPAEMSTVPNVRGSNVGNG